MGDACGAVLAHAGRSARSAHGGGRCDGRRRGGGGGGGGGGGRAAELTSRPEEAQHAAAERHAVECGARGAILARRADCAARAPGRSELATRPEETGGARTEGNSVESGARAAVLTSARCAACAARQSCCGLGGASDEELTIRACEASLTVTKRLAR